MVMLERDWLHDPARIPTSVTITLTPAELVALGSEVQNAAIIGRGPRQSAAIAVLDAAHALITAHTKPAPAFDGGDNGPH